MPDNLPAGLYDLVLTKELRELASRLAGQRLQPHIKALDPEAGAEHLAQFVGHLFRRALKSVKPVNASTQAELVNKVLQVLLQETSGSGIEPNDEIVLPPQRLTAIVQHNNVVFPEPPPCPGVPLRTSDLLVNGPREVSVGPEVLNEIASADRVDLLCSFLKWSGLRLVRDALREFLNRNPGGLRVLTTVYMGATDRRVVDELVNLGANLRLSYDTERTRLHAKAWLFARDSGFSTALIGSSNLSAAALLDGLEWNVRISGVENPAILSKFQVTFDQYWNEGEFVDYDPDRDGARFDTAVSRERTGEPLLLSGLEVEPRPFQRTILESLEAERRHGHMRNLVVSATGTGKTVVAALDYKRERERRGEISLLFVAHREEILRQSLRMFREVLRDQSFGEELYRGNMPTKGHHVFASIQSLHAGRLAEIPPDAFDFVVVDEFHHARARTYERLLSHLKPQILLGLTATPERADSRDILVYFDGRIASELRLWTALDQGLLIPFQYFGIHDNTDLSALEWNHGSYDAKQLENIYTGGDARLKIILDEVRDKIENIGKMRALGFCVSIAHAEFMAQRFSDRGIPSIAVSANTPRRERSAALRKLRDGQVRVLFAVDLFNEGVDLPDVDTVLFLRPTESATVFLQQLGRGLRRASGKECLTVLDFIGNAHKRFRFDVRYRALVGGTTRGIREQVEQGFPFLPPGCSIRLDKEAQASVLENIRQSLGTSGWRRLVEDLRGLGRDLPLDEFLRETRCSIEEIYATGRSWTEMKREAGLPVEIAVDGEEPLARAVSRMLHIADPVRCNAFREWLASDVPPTACADEDKNHRLQLMLLALLGQLARPVEELAKTLTRIWQHGAIRKEIVEVLVVLDDRTRNVYEQLGIERIESAPLLVHAEYTRDEIFAALGIVKKGKVYRPQEGVFYDATQRIDLLMVTLNKTEREYSATTMYNDYPISPTLFHWESQNSTRTDSPKGQRYVHHEQMESAVLLFVRSDKKVRSRTMPYTFLGPVSYVTHTGERPMQVTWRLEHQMPARFFLDTKIAAG